MTMSSLKDKSKGNPNKLLSCKDEVLLGTMNVRTLKLKWRREELFKYFHDQKINILGLVDHKLVHSDDADPIDIRTENGCTMITTSAWRNNAGAAVGGVGVIVNKSSHDALSDIQPVCDRILVLHFEGNPKTTVIVHYSPTEGSDDAEEHYESLKAVIETIPKHNVLFVIGDFNAHIGKNDAHHSFHERTNNNGKLLLELCMEEDLTITNTHFQKKQGKLWTYISDMNGSKSQVDYILIRRKWKNTVKNVEAYNTFASNGSDHRVLTARLKLSLRAGKQPPRKVNYDWKALKDPKLQQQYTVGVRNRYAALCTGNQDMTEKYQCFIDACAQYTKELIPVKKKIKTKKFSSDLRIKDAREKVESAYLKYQKDSSAENQSTLKEVKKGLQEAYTTVESEHLDEMISLVEEADEKSRHGESWKLINHITGRKSAKKGIIKGKSKQERLNSWYKHFSELLGKEPVVTDADEDIPKIFDILDISTEDFTQEEYQDVKKRLKENKSADPDGITAEILKRCEFDDIILEYANCVLNTGQKPAQWSILHIITIPKSGDLSLTGNYRGISLSSIASKITNKLLLNRIQSKVEPLLRNNQNGFRPGRSTVAHILALRRLIEEVKKLNLKAVLVFVDFKKAFDSVHREKMFKILRAYGIPDKIVDAIAAMYKDIQARVITPDGETELFDIVAGVLQGDTLAPYLFAIVLDYVMRKAIDGREEELGFHLVKRKSRRVGPVTITDTDFADDIALISELMSQAQELLSRVEIEAAKVGLHCNAKKTEAMLYNQDDMDTCLKSITGELIAIVENFKYLGGQMEDCPKDINVRKALAWVACNKLNRVWKSKLKRIMKVRLFRATVEYVLLYGSETWTLTKTLTQRIDGCYTRLLRAALNISWKSHTTNVELYGNIPPVSQTIKARRLKLAGHCVRHEDEEASKLVLWKPTHGKSNRGRKRIAYTDNLLNDVGAVNINELKSMMEDREIWREEVAWVRAGARPK